MSHLADGAAPEAPNFDPKLAAKRPLSAFTVLEGGDVFESMNGKPPPEGARRAQAYAEAQLHFHRHGAPDTLEAQVRADVVSLLGANLELIGRMEVARPIDVELIPAGQPLSRYGFPRSSGANTVGLFWDDAKWPAARMALRADKLATIPHLAVHELAHAVHFLAFTVKERDLIYRTLLRTYGSRAAVDEVFAIYTERELFGRWTEHDLHAPGVYGMARSRWDENHVFTRFVRHLFFPHKPLAGPRLGGAMPKL